MNRLTDKTPCCAIALLIALLFAPVANAQDSSTQDADPSEATQESLFERTLGQDIATAGFYELVAWLESLGLSTLGDRGELAGRLYEHYQIRPEGGDASASEPRIIVDAAERSRYFTIEQTEERYIRLSGGATVRLNDPDQDVVHHLTADEIVFNQEKNEVSATGNVVYTLEREATTERFSGNAVTIDLDDWRGAFLNGVTERSTTVEEDEIDFFFTGDYITRSAQDVVVMEGGTITSSTADPPNYHVTAEKIWVLAPGEWGLQGVVLYVGRVPVFYFPFFFRPGDRLFFNPDIGRRDRVGSFVQTTTYLIGKQEEEDAALSFLRITDQEQGERDLEIDGLYLRDATGARPEYPEGWTLKVMADVYSALGAFVGTRGVLADLGAISSLEFYSGLAVSRNIYAYSYSGQATTYSPFYLDGSEARSVLNTSNFGQAALPLRLGFDLQLALRAAEFTSSLGFEYYTDPLFLRDFDQRAEQIDWLQLLGQAAEDSYTPPEVNQLDWQLSAGYSPRWPSLEPGLQQFRIREASALVRWRSQTIPDALLPDEVLDADQSPDAHFYALDQIRFPVVNMSLAGTLLRFPREHPREDPERRDEEQPDLRPPWSQAAEEQSEQQERFRLPPIRSAPSLGATPQGTSGSLGYTVAPTANVEHIAPTGQWSTPQEAEFRVDYSAASLRAAGGLDFRLSLLGGLATLNSGIDSVAQYRTLFNRDPGLEDEQWTNLQGQAFAFTSSATSSNNSVSFRPLASVALLADSSVTYSIDLLLHQLTFDQTASDGSPIYQNEFIAWDDQFVRNHQVQMSVALAVLGGQRATLSAALPPRNARVGSELSLAAGPLSLNVSAGVDEGEESGRQWEPISSSQTLAIGEDAYLRNSLTYDPEATELRSDSISATFRSSSASLTAQTTEGYDFGGPGVGWVRNDERQLRLTRATFRTAPRLEPDPFYRNRIRFSATSTLAWEMDLLRFTQNSFRFGLRGTFSVHEFLDLNLSLDSTNLQTYAYIGPLADVVGRPRKSLFADLAKSFNVFNRADRIDSAFNLQRIRLDATHHLEDWDLSVGYSGNPELVTDTEGVSRYEWRGELAVSLEWRPIPELRGRFTADEDQIRIGSGP